MAKRKSSSWINPSFDQWESVDDDVFFLSPSKNKTVSVAGTSKTVKRNTRNGKCTYVKRNADTSWVTKYSPETKEELAVHKKKVLEVEDWLRKYFYSNSPYQNPELLLLTGPTGVGKTATIKALANDLQFEVQEWSSAPCESMPYRSNTDGIRQWNDALSDITRQSQHSIFSNFLLRVNKYPSLFSTMPNRIILIEEFPNVYLKDATAFHNLLRKFRKSAKCPAVFIVSDCTSGESLENHLFPKTLQFDLNITNISFNPIAPTMMIKALNRICSIVKDSRDEESLSSKCSLEDIASGNMGDIRSAINALQFFTCQKKRVLSQNSTSLKRKRQSSQSNTNINKISGNKRDSSLFLFHALGKILHCKRDNTSKPDYERLPPNLSHLERNPLISNPEEVFDRTSVSAENFALFLHENYLAFIDNVDVAIECSSYFSDADVISIEWTGKDVLRNYTASVAARGLMFNLVPMNSSQRWKAIHKPQYFATVKENRNLNSYLGNMFKDTRLSLKELKTEFLPYLLKIGTSSLNFEKKEMVHRIGCITAKKFMRHQGESLNEKDFAYEDTQSQVVLSSQILKGNEEINLFNSESKKDDDEDIAIEEYDF